MKKKREKVTTGLDFIKLPSASEHHKLCEDIIHNYVAEEFKDVPDWVSLSNTMESLIKKEGLGKKDIKDIAFQAATQLGMHK